MKIRKAVIPAAGLGTRFLPATKTIPKEMLPIVDKPTLLYIVEEAVAAGITEIVLIAGRGKSAIEDFFDTSYELEDTLAKTGKSELLAPLREVLRHVKVISLRQHVALGLGHAVLCAEPVVGGEPFAVLLGDEVMITAPGEPSGIAQLCRIHEDTGKSAVAIMEVEAADVSKYGIVKVKSEGPNLWSVEDVIEKPAPDQAPSRYALPGRYVFDAALFVELRQTRPGRGGEIQLTDAMSALAKRRGLLATTLKARRFDAGDKLGYLLANIELGLEHPQTGAGLRAHLSQRFGGK